MNSTNTLIISNIKNIIPDSRLTLQDLLSIRSEKQLLHSLTDELWQEYYELLKQRNIPLETSNPTSQSPIPYIVNRKWMLTNTEGIKTTYEYHCDVIKDVLKVIRKKCKTKIAKDVVYSIGNIKELLKYEPNMQSRLVSDNGFTYFEVWLDK